MRLQLREGGTKLFVDGALTVAAPMQEYEEIYARFAELVKSGTSELDGSRWNWFATA